MTGVQTCALPILTGAQAALQTPAFPRRYPDGAATVAGAALEDHLDAANADEPALEVVEQDVVTPANDDQQVDVGEGVRRKRRQEQGGMPGAVAVRLGGVVERRLFAHVAGAAFNAARRADDLHSVSGPCIVTLAIEDL